MRVPILTYHAAYVSGMGYASNDHAGFAADLAALGRLGWRVESLRRVVDAFLGKAVLEGKVVGLAFDDGTDFDFHDLDHPSWGVQRSMFNILRDYEAAHPLAQPGLHATSFVVVSPAARVALDASALAGRGWWTDGWWKPAIASGRWGIANHSWDHNHGGIGPTAAGVAAADTFRSVDSFAAAEAEIGQAAAFLKLYAPNPGDALFAYPYGEVNDYLALEYLPCEGERIGVVAAFGCEAGPLTAASPRWNLPRYVFKRDWNAPEELVRLLGDLAH